MVHPELATLMISQVVTQQVPVWEVTIRAGHRLVPKLVCWSCREPTSKQICQIPQVLGPSSNLELKYGVVFKGVYIRPW